MNIHTLTEPMSDIQIAAKEVRFPCATWEVQGESIEPVKGTWALPPERLRHVFERMGVADKVRGLVACPQCRTPSILTSEIVTEDKGQHIGLMPLLRCAGCPFACVATFEDWDQRKLYCVIYDTPTRQIKEYYHGNSQADVTEQFWNGHVHDRSIVRVVGIAPVIGYFVDDKEGLELHV